MAAVLVMGLVRFTFILLISYAYETRVVQKYHAYELNCTVYYRAELAFFPSSVCPWRDGQAELPWVAV